MFIAELNLYIDYLKEELENDTKTDQFSKRKKYYASFYQNLCNGISYYRSLNMASDAVNRERFAKALDNAILEMDVMNYQYEIG